jgi:hypothetical protein
VTVVTLGDQTWPHDQYRNWRQNWTKVRSRWDWHQEWYVSWDWHWHWNTRWYWSWIPGWSCLAALWTAPRKPKQPESAVWFEVES